MVIFITLFLVHLKDFLSDMFAFPATNQDDFLLDALCKERQRSGSKCMSTASGMPSRYRPESSTELATVKAKSQRQNQHRRVQCAVLHRTI